MLVEIVLFFCMEKMKILVQLLGPKMTPKITKMRPKRVGEIDPSLFFLHFSRFRGANSIFLDLERFWEGFGMILEGFGEGLVEVWGRFCGYFLGRVLEIAKL